MQLIKFNHIVVELISVVLLIFATIHLANIAALLLCHYCYNYSITAIAHNTTMIISTNTATAAVVIIIATTIITPICIICLNMTLKLSFILALTIIRKIMRLVLHSV